MHSDAAMPQLEFVESFGALQVRACIDPESILYLSGLILPINNLMLCRKVKAKPCMKLMFMATVSDERPSLQAAQ